ncbi:hypothetical protein [Winogradskyella sp. 3972H.M.0a.05]|uniref:hypothetical protein n=1 Tax=Winogradskyella sp. 3972H.M.0a.05 TaxID=2950277 RepID=UPI00339A54CC
MQERVLKYFLIAKKMKFENIAVTDIVDFLYDEMQKNEQELSYSITIKILDKLGYKNSEIIYLMNNSKWKDTKRSADDLFFDAIDLDDDLS